MTELLADERTKRAVRTSLAIVIAYAIALSMEWEKPYWTGLAVVSVSALSTTGESVQKGLLRIAGAICGSIAGFILLAAFVQDRWPFIAALSVYSAICTYFSLGTERYNYFWQQAGYFAVVIGFETAFDPINAFDIGIARTQESATGLLVYIVVGLVIWPRDSRNDMENTVADLVATLQKLLNDYGSLLRGSGGGHQSAGLAAKANTLLARFGTLLDAAEVDSWEVNEVRPAWRRCQNSITDLRKTLDRWHVDEQDLKTIRLDIILPNLSAVLEELDNRLVQVQRMLAGHAPLRQPIPVDLIVESESLGKLSFFDKAAVSLNCDEIEQLDRATQALFAAVCEISGFRSAVPPTPTKRRRSHLFELDTDRLVEAVRVVEFAWLMFLAIIYIPDLPSGLAAIGLATRLVIIHANIPTSSIQLSLSAPMVVSFSFAFPVYVFVLPQISRFYELGVVLFVVTFALGYIFHKPQQSLWRLWTIDLFLILIGITNTQSYDFGAVVGIGLMWMLIVSLMSATLYLPVSQLPDHVFRRMVRRFFESSAFLMTVGVAAPGSRSFWARRRIAFHQREVATLPQKLEKWGRTLRPEQLGTTTADQLQVLLANLQALSLRLDSLMEARAAMQSDTIVRQLRPHVVAWRKRTRELMLKLAEAPETVDPAVLQSRLDSTLTRLEARIEAVLDQADETMVSANDRENIYRLLGARRGVSQALVNVSGPVTQIDWARLREPRF